MNMKIIRYDIRAVWNENKVNGVCRIYNNCMYML